MRKGKQGNGLPKDYGKREKPNFSVYGGEKNNHIRNGRIVKRIRGNNQVHTVQASKKLPNVNACSVVKCNGNQHRQFDWKIKKGRTITERPLCFSIL